MPIPVASAVTAAVYYVILKAAMQQADFDQESVKKEKNKSEIYSSEPDRRRVS